VTPRGTLLLADYVEFVERELPAAAGRARIAL